MKPITHINYPLNVDKALFYANKLRQYATAYTDKRYNVTLDNWHMIECQNLFAEQLMFELGVEGKVRYYWQQPNSVIPDHIDNDTKCGINFILSHQPAPITIEGTDYVYTQAVLDTTKTHSVHTDDNERILLKVSVYTNNYAEVVRKLRKWIVNV